MASAGVTNYLQNKVLVDWLLRAQAFTQLTNVYVALLTSTRGLRANSTAYALNDTIHLTANDGKVHLYKATTAGTTAASQASLYPGANTEAITDGTTVFTEQDTTLRAGTAAEANYTGYARQAIATSLANFAGTQGATTTTASTGTGGTTSNNAAINFPLCTAGTNFVWGVAFFDALTVGNQLNFEALTTPQAIVNGSTPSFAISQLTLTWQ